VIYLKRTLLVAVTLLVVGLLAGLVVYRILDWERDEITDSIRAETSSSYVTLSDGVTEYELAGPDSGNVVVLASGASVPYYIWDPTFKALTDAGFRVLRYNYYGRGYSDRPRIPYNRDLYNRQLSDLLRVLEIREPVFLAGLSMGGWVTAAFAATYPRRVAGIVWIDPAHRSYATPDTPEWLARVLFVWLNQEKTVSGQLTDFLHPENFPDWTDRYRIQMSYSGFRYGRISTFYHFAGEDHPEDFELVGKSGIPVLLIWGRQDRTLPFELSDEVRSLVPVRFVPVDSAGHLPHLEKSGPVNRVIVDFLSELELDGNSE
jgi:pimeloyl-ACP methyl ester carboxylesterase